MRAGMSSSAMDQTVIKHTTGAYGALPTVAGAGQSGSLISVSAMQGPLNVGDIVSFAGVNSVNRTTKQDNGTLAQFAITAPVAAGATALPIYPALVAAPGAYATVTASPANGAAVTCATAAGSIYRKNIVFDKRAFTMVSVDLVEPNGVMKSPRQPWVASKCVC